MSVKIFLSTVSNEFSVYRDQLRTDLTRHNGEVKVQEDFKDLGGDTLDKLEPRQSHIYYLICSGAPGSALVRKGIRHDPDQTTDTRRRSAPSRRDPRPYPPLDAKAYRHCARRRTEADYATIRDLEKLLEVTGGK
jgi:hypothetical protein